MNNELIGRIDMNAIKEKINSLMPSVAYFVTEFKDEGLGCKAFFMTKNILYNASTVAERHVDELIAKAIEDYINKTTVIKSVNMRTQAQPYLDELIAEIDDCFNVFTNGEYEVSHDKLKATIKKWKGVK